ncbi:MAG: (2Fe-2S) ferredoxin domain-containing protein [Cyanobacteria bacterium J06621_12]
MTSEIELPAVNQIPVRNLERIVVCRGRSCRKYQAEEVFEQFKQNLPSHVELMSVPCLGQCGNGSMVVVESDQTWYSQVHPKEVEIVIRQHIMGKSPVAKMIYQRK